MKRWMVSMVVVVGARSADALAQDASAVDGTVVLKDGTIVHGALVEVVAGDHVIVRVDGEAKVLPWAAVSTVLPGNAPPAVPVVPPVAANMLASLSGEDGPLVDWPEPDRTPPPIMSSRLSVGVEAGVAAAPTGTYALAAELYPWSWGPVTLGFHAAYGWAGLVGPTIAERLMFDVSLGPVQYGVGVGFAHSFRSGTASTAGAPDRVDAFDSDLTHLSVFVTRHVMLRALLGLQVPVSSGCGGQGMPCGSSSVVYGLGSLMWNFDLSHGGR